MRHDIQVLINGRNMYFANWEKAVEYTEKQDTPCIAVWETKDSKRTIYTHYNKAKRRQDGMTIYAQDQY